MRASMLAVLAILPFLARTAAAADPPQDGGVVIKSAYFSPGVPLAESKLPVYSFSLEAKVDDKGQGRGTLYLNPNPPEYDEYGDVLTGREADLPERKRSTVPVVPLECRIEFVKSGFVARVNEPPTKRSVYLIRGPKITSTLHFATEGPGLTSGRLLVHGEGGRVKYVVEMHELKPDTGPPVPCHPGCFPAGTPVAIPGGRTKAIERVRVGEAVTTIDANGRASETAVRDVFTTTNRLVEVRTDRGTAVTTDAQPFSLADGTFRRAGDLKEGDRIWQWRDGARAACVVRSVEATGRDAKVFNLIVGDSAVFVADGFLARGKPPADAAPASAASESVPSSAAFDAPPPAAGATIQR